MTTYTGRAGLPNKALNGLEIHCDMLEVPSLEPLLAAEENVLPAMGRRLHNVEAFQAELEFVTKQKTFLVRDPVVWTMVFDWRDALVIQFASWVRGMYEEGGFLGQIQAHCLRDFRQKSKSGRAQRPKDWLEQLVAKSKATSFQRLFPAVKAPFPKPEDVASLRARFVDEFNAVVDDRDSNRAHPHENKHAKNAKMLDLKQLRAFLTQAETFLNDIRLVGRQSTFGYPGSGAKKGNATMVELVDMIVLGNARRRKLVLGPRSREEYYEYLHAKHDLITTEPKPPFNAAR